MGALIAGKHSYHGIPGSGYISHQMDYACYYQLTEWLSLCWCLQLTGVYVGVVPEAVGAAEAVASDEPWPKLLALQVREKYGTRII